MLNRLSRSGLILLAALSGLAHTAWGQEPVWRAREGLPVGSEAERYLRVLQLTGKAPLYPWTLRGFTPGELSRILPTDQDHPWADRMDFSLGELPGFHGGWVTPEAGLIFNSSYPFGENDGALWAGKGVTGVVRGGGYFRFGRLHVRIAPEAFWAQNGAFDLAPNGLGGEGAFRDGVEPGRIDQPQRFGNGAYGRVDLGSSSVHLALPGITIGASGAGQQWGPAIHYPLLLGNNAGGFPHLLLQTSGPVDLWAFRVDGRFVVGSLQESEYSPVQEGEKKRFLSGGSVTLLPRGLEGLELGFARIVEMVWPEGGIGLRELLRPLGQIDNEFQEGDNPREENQIASAHFRWTLPSAGVEVYGEFIRQDFTRDLRHLLEEPDNFSARTLGVQKVWPLRDGKVVAFRGESVSALTNHSERMGRFRLAKWVPRPLPHYSHGGVRQGHTEYGQILGSPTAYGGSGWTLGVDLYDEEGRTSLALSRSHRTDWLAIHAGTIGPGIADVVYALKLEAVRFRNGYQWTATLNPSVNLNRNVEEGNDVWNLGLGIGIKGLPW